MREVRETVKSSQFMQERCESDYTKEIEQTMTTGLKYSE